MTADKTDIFISYGRQDDEPFTRRLRDDLAAKGFRIWWDRASMPSRGLTFTQEIRDAIDRANRLLLIVGPSALTSAYVQSEWRHALLFAKSVVPLLRIGTYDTLPEPLRQLHCPDCRESRAYDEALIEVVRVLSDPLPTLGPLRGETPRLPPHFLDVRTDLDALGTKVLPDLEGPAVVDTARQTTVVHGMGGIGKSVLAAAFSRATKTRRAFADGVVWLTIGQAAERARPVRMLASAFGVDPARFVDPAEAEGNLRALLEDKSCLIVFDDVWCAGDVKPLLHAMGSRCRALITSRDASLATALGAEMHSIGLLNAVQSLELLATWAGQPAEALPAKAHDVVRECGGLALALALCGARVRDGMSWADMRDALAAAELDFLDHEYGSVMKSLKVSIDALPPAHASLYAQLVVFRRPAVVTENAVLTLWAYTGGLSERQARSLLVDLRNKALLRLDGDAPQRTVSLHDLQHDYLRRPPNDDSAARDHTLLEAYRRRSPAGWSSGPNDGYFFQHLGFHLLGAGRRDELVDLLCHTPDWVEAKSHAVADPMALADDVDAVWDALDRDSATDHVVAYAALQAVRLISLALESRDDLEIEILVRLGRLDEAQRSVRGRADLAARFEGLHTSQTVLGERGQTSVDLMTEMEATARKMPDCATMAIALARVGTLLGQADDGRGRALVDESLALLATVEGSARQIDVIEQLLRPFRAIGDRRIDAALERVERAERATAAPRELAKTLGRLGMILGSDSPSGGALLHEAQQLALRLSREGDTTLRADFDLVGIPWPAEGENTATEFDGVDALKREAVALAASEDPRAAEALAATERAIQTLPDPLMRCISQAGLSDELMAAGAIDAAIDVAGRLSDRGFRLAARRRIVRAMLVKRDGRAGALFEQIDASARAQPPDEAEQSDALGAVAVALHASVPALSAEILNRLSTDAESADQSPRGSLLILSLAKALARVRDRRCQELFDRVFRHATAPVDGIELVLGQMVLRSLGDALLECGFVDAAKLPISKIRATDQRAFALSALAGDLAANDDFATAEALVEFIDFADLGEAARIRVLAAKALRTDAQALGFFENWRDHVADLRRRFNQDNALGALARSLVELGKLREAREVIYPIAQPDVREDALVRLAKVLVAEHRVSEALRPLLPRVVDRYIHAVADLATMSGGTGPWVQALREVTRITGWARADWKTISEGFGRPSLSET
jgi:NB-ARC domain/TIR domain